MKNIISIVSEQLVPNYIFIKEIAQPSDKLIFISTRRMANKLKTLRDSLSNNGYDCLEIVLEKDGDEENYTELYNQIEKKLTENLLPNSEVISNLTGGTKLISITLKEVLEKNYPKSIFYYIPWPQNKVIQLNKNISSKDLKYRVTVNEYFKVSGINDFESKTITQSEEYTKSFFSYFLNLDSIYLEMIDNLRKYRKEKRKTPYLIADIEKGYQGKIAIPNIKDLLRLISFPLKESDKIYSYEISYITGGWFEEYVYSMLKSELNLNSDNILINSTILESEDTNRNEFDVIFTFGNKLFAIECKTIISNLGGKDKTSIIYKASALKDSRLGKISANYYIFSLDKSNKDSEEFNRLSKNMKLSFYNREYFSSEEKHKELISQIRQAAKD